MRKLMVILGLICMMAGIVSAGQVSRTLYFDQPEIKQADNLASVTLPGCLTISNPGEPPLPRQAMSILLPAGEEAVRIEYVLGDRVKVQGSYDIAPANRQYPIGYAGPFERTEPLVSVYQSDSKYPSTMEQGLSTQFFRGHGIAYFNVCPFEYYPKTGELYYYRQIEVNIITEPSAKANDAYRMFLRTDSKTNRKLTGYIDNTESINSYYGQTSLDVDDDGNYDYLIITEESLQSSFEELAAYKNRTGFLTEIMLVSDIYGQYTGSDQQDMIRNCIIDQYQNHGVEYVLLAGDTELVPHRGLYDDAGGYEDEFDVPADIYFAGLDGSWNQDGDNRWGEPDEADLAGEVYIGRMAVDSPTEAENFINKTILYQYQPVAEDVNNILMTGEDLGWEVWGRAYKEEIRCGSDAWGYHTAGFPRYGFDQDTLYDLNGDWSPLGDLVPRLNAGMGLVNHLGHANNTYMMKLYNSNINDNNFTNDGVTHGYYLVYSQGCYCGAFDNRDSYGSYGQDCISEVWTTIENGPVILVTNSRYGWGDVDSTNGSSQYYDRQFFDAMLDENITRVGETQSDAKLDNIPYIDFAQNRWCHYCSNLFGDPTLDLWLAAPVPMTAGHDNVILIGMEDFSVTLADSDDDPISGARVALSQNGVCIGRGLTNESGVVTIDIIGSLDDTTELNLVATAHNFDMYETTIDVVPPEGPYIAYENYEIDDELGGNDDGILDYGETIELWMTLENVGSENADNIYALISCDDPYVFTIDNTASFGDMAPGETGMSEDSYTISISPNCPDMHNIGIEVEMYADGSEDPWTRTINLVAHAPVTSFVSCTIDDMAGNGDGIIDPGETIEFNPSILNSGSSELGEFDGLVFTNDPNITITGNGAPGGPIAPGGQASLNSACMLTVSEDCPIPKDVSFTLSVDASNGHFSSMTFTMLVGGMSESFESGVSDWEHSNISSGFLDQWHLSDQRNHTESGQYSWKCGDEGSGDYANLLDAGLEMSELNLNENCLLKYWQWIRAEYSTSYPSYAYDGGLVELSIDGGENWEQIFPVGGYPYFVRIGGTPGPFSAETPIFSGTSNWREITFDLGDYANETANIRFRFGSDGSVPEEGWFVDDIKITADNPYPVPGNLDVELVNQSEVILGWVAPEGITPDGYNVYRNDEPAQYGDTPVNDVLITELSFVDEECIPTRENYYVITAIYDGDTESNYSNEAYLPAQPTDIDDGENALPLTYELMQNYPNPFNPQTTINFNLPEQSPVKLEIYDILGRKVETLVDQAMPAGYHSVIWNASPYATGIYFYKITADDFTESRKMVMVK